MLKKITYKYIHNQIISETFTLNKILILTTSILLTACVSLEFDNLEYDRFVTMKQLAQVGTSECGTPGVKLYVDKLTEDIAHQNLYAANRTSRNDIRISTQEVAGMISGLSKRYSEPTAPSVTYCKQKFDNISIGISTILSTLGKL